MTVDQLAAIPSVKCLKNGDAFVRFVDVLRQLGINTYEGPFLFDQALGTIKLELGPAK